MKAKLLAALNIKYKDFGFSPEAIRVVAHHLAKKIIYEEEVEGAVLDIQQQLEFFHQKNASER